MAGYNPRPMGESVAAEFRKYAGIIGQLLGRGGGIAITSESATAIQVERGTVLPLMLDSVSPEGLARVERLIEITRAGGVDRIAVVDRLGHHRSIYRPILVYAWLSALAARGGSAAEACWIALALHRAGKVYLRDVWVDLASDLFGKVTKAQQESGAFLQMSNSDNPEA